VKTIFNVGAKMYSYAGEEIELPLIRFLNPNASDQPLSSASAPLFAVTLIPADAECVG
jgi:hypothetical protein